MASSETIARVFQVLSRAYPEYAAKYLQGEGAVQTLRLYQRMLDDIPDDVLERAALGHIAESPWFPHVSDLRGRCLGCMMPALPDAYEAWGMVCRYMRDRVPLYHNGRLYRAKPLPPIVKTAVERLGGWGVLEDGGDFVSNRARFVEVFERLVERERVAFRQLPFSENVLSLGCGGKGTDSEVGDGR